MELLTKEIKKALPPLYSGEEIYISKKVFVCKFFNPCGAGTWYVCEGSRIWPDDHDDDDWQFFGLVDLGYGQEWGYFNLSELESVITPLGLGIERDIHFENEPASKYAEDFGFEGQA